MNTEQTKPLTVQEAKDEVARKYGFETWNYYWRVHTIDPIHPVQKMIDEAMFLYGESQIENNLFSENDVHRAISMARGITIRPDGTYHYHSDNLQIVEHIKAIKKLKS